MKLRLSACVALTAWIVVGGLAFAEEPYLKFVQGLREQGYHDYAILYLDQIAQKPNTPDLIKQVIPYQKAMTLLHSSKSTRSPEKQMEQLDQALAFLEQFVKDNPDHPSAADANLDRATILLGKGQAEVQQSKAPSNQGSKRQFQDRARGFISKARGVFQTAFDQNEAKYKTFPAFIDKEKDPGQVAARAVVEQNMISASLNLGMCSYEEAQTHDSDSNDFKLLLNKAADEFEKMWQKNRSQVGGLYARAWQGKCYEEQKDLQKAMGIYDELLEHEGKDPSLVQLQTQTRYFKLVCLKERKDFQLVIDQAEEWKKKNQSQIRTRIGLGIQWEQAQAYEALGDDRTILKADAERLWKQAKTVATEINKYRSEYQDVAQTMLQRLTTKLGGKEKEPKTFDDAFGLARQAFSTAQEIKKELDAAIKDKRPADEITKLKLDWSNELNEAAHYFELAFALPTKGGENEKKREEHEKDLAAARLYYAYVNFYQRKNYEAAVLAQFVARTADKDDGTVGLDAAYMAMAAFAQAYNDNKAPLDQKGEDMTLIIKACNLIADRWPSTEKAYEAYMMLGRMYSAQKNPAEAAKWFGKVPESDAKYPEAQLAAGQAYWTVYLSAGRLTGPAKPTVDQLAATLKSAEDHLRVGIKKLSDTSPKEGKAPPELILAKMSLSQIIISQGKDAEAMKLLLDDPQSVIKAVTVANEKEDRPPEGITSRKFATEIYKLLLRTYIGIGNLEKARETMAKLEEIVAAGGIEGGTEITDLYVSLGRQMKEELARFRANGETEQADKLMTSLETFLGDMAGRKEQTFGSLSWLGETYFALGETMSADAAKASSFYEKAGNSFAAILTRARDDQTFASTMQLYGVKMRQVRVLQLKKEFEPAETLLSELLKENANNLKLQISAAELYQEWGSSGQADSAKKLITAIQGNTKNGTWGWGQIAFKVQKSSEFLTNPMYLETFFLARFNGSLCRKTYAQDLGPKDKQKQLEGCRTELIATSSVVKEIPEEWYAKFNALYRDVMQELGQPVTDLPVMQDVPVSAPEKPKPAVEATTKKKEAETPPPPPPTPIVGYAVVGGVGLLTLLVLGWIMMKGSKTQTKPKSFGAVVPTGNVSFKGVAIGDPLPPATFAAPKPKARSASPTGAAPATKPAQRPATKPVGTGSTGATASAPKPKPKPPSPPTGK